MSPIAPQLSTPPVAAPNQFDHVTRAEVEDYALITSLSPRVLLPLSSAASSTNDQVWHREGDYRSGEGSTRLFAARGNLDGWTLVAGGNYLGTDGRALSLMAPQLSTPPVAAPNPFDHVTRAEVEDYALITLLSLRVLLPLLSAASSTSYEVWHREGDY